MKNAYETTAATDSIQRKVSLRSSPLRSFPPPPPLQVVYGFYTHGLYARRDTNRLELFLLLWVSNSRFLPSLTLVRVNLVPRHSSLVGSASGVFHALEFCSHTTVLPNQIAEQCHTIFNCVVPTPVWCFTVMGLL